MWASALPAYVLSLRGLVLQGTPGFPEEVEVSDHRPAPRASSPFLPSFPPQLGLAFGGGGGSSVLFSVTLLCARAEEHWEAQG